MIEVTTTHEHARAASWGAIIAGAVTVLAVSILLSMLTTSLGLGMVDAQSGNPLEGVGTAVGFSSAVAVLISLAAGGFVAGRLAGRAGFTHGFLTWAVSMLVAIVLSVMAISGAARTTASSVGSVASAAGSVAGAAGNVAGDAAASLAGAIDDKLIGDFDLDRTRRDLRSQLRNTQIDALQPENLEPVLEGARDDVTGAARELAFNPGDFGRIAEDLGKKLKERVDSVAGDINRDDVIDALVNNGMTREEAEQAADKAVGTYIGARDAITARIDRAEQTLASARQRIDEMEAEARRQADAAASAASSAALWGFLASLIGAGVAAFAGLFGMRSRDRYHFG